MTDFRALLARSARGEREALDSLLAAYYPTVQSMVHRALATDLRLKRPWLAAMFSTGDVVQEVFCGVVRDIDTFDGEDESAFVAYLATMVKNRLVDAIRFHEAVRRDQRRAIRLPDSEPDQDQDQDAVDPARAAALDEQVQRFLRVVNKFEPRERMLLRERLERGVAFRDLAEQLGYPSEDAARKAFYAAQAKLVWRLRSAGVTVGD